MWRVIGILTVLALAGCGIYTDQRSNSREAAAERRWPPEGRLIEVDGVQVHYLQKGRGPDVVLLHGAGGNLRDFSFSLMDVLARRYRVTAFDRPGLGYTGRLPDSAGAFNANAESPQDQAALLARAAQQIGITRPVVVGHSFGGAVAMAWALDHDPAAMVSLAGAVMPWPGALDTQYRVLGTGLGGALVPGLVTASVDPDNTAGIAASIFRPQAMPDGYLAHVGPGLSLRRETIRANGRQVADLRGHLVGMSQRYAALRLPVEFVHGDADPIVGLDIHSRAAARLVPGAGLTVLPGVGHMPHHADEAAIVALIDRAARRAGLR